MITAYEQEVLLDKIKELSELEFVSVLKQMAEHLRQNNWEHIIDDCFDIETYEDELEEARERLDSYRERTFYAEGIIKKIKEAMQ